MKQLWAPWRLEYIKSADEQSGCLFCEAAAAGDEEEALVIHRGTHAIALLNKFPYTSGHFMVAPVRHVGEFGALREWLGEHVHRHGRKFSPQETLRRATGATIDAKPYLAYLREKYGAGVAA